MRRYKRHEKPLYDQAYNHHQTASVVLNKGVRANDMRNFFNEKNPDDLRAFIRRLEGIGDSGKVYDKNQGTWKPAELLFSKEQAEAARMVVEEEENRLKSLGYSNPKVSADKLEKWYQWQAIVDVRTAELKKLKQLLQPFLEKELKKEEEEIFTMILRANKWTNEHGPLIDAQEAGWVNGVLCVTDERSPYRGMSFADYKSLGKQFRQSPEGRPYFEAFGKRRIPPEILPDWPKGVKNHLKKS